MSRKTPSAAEKPGTVSVWAANVEDWITRYSLWLEIAIVGAGALLRISGIAATYLNPDEALHFSIANQTSPLAVYETSLGNAHPPLYFLLLYFWQLIGNSEAFLRLPSMLSGTAMIFVIGRWLTNVAGRAAGFAAMLIVAFSPTLIFLSTEMRGYSFLLLAMALTLYCLQRAFQLDSEKWMVRSSLCLAVAVFTHYSAVWFTIAAGVYGLLRIREMSRATLRTWLASQCGIALIYVALYFTHISHLHGGGMEREATDGWLRYSYFQPGVDTEWEFYSRGTGFLFQFLFAQRLAGQIALALFVLALLGLCTADVRKRMRMSGPSFAVLLLLPFLLTAGAAGWRLYPYGGSRHDSFLAVFAVAGISVSLAMLARWQSWAIFAAAAVILPVWIDRSDPMPQSLPLESQRKTLMDSAIDFIHASIPRGSILFVDNQSFALSPYYLCRNEIMAFRTGKNGLSEANCGGYRFLIAPQWALDGNTFSGHIARIRTDYQVKAPEQIWVFNAGWGVNLLSQVSPELLGPVENIKGFGTSISVFQVSDANAAAASAAGLPNGISINAGGEAYADSGGRKWSADTGYTGGRAFRAPGSIQGTLLSALYEDERQGTFPFRYEFELPNRDYRVYLRFAQISGERRGERVFNVSLNHDIVLANFDISAESGESRKAVDREFTVRVANGRLLIEFTPLRLGAAVSAIEVTPK